MMNSLNSDILGIILARLPLKSITSCKLVCNEWKSIVEASFLRELFLCQHQNSHSSWSLICSHSQEEILAHCRCDNWGLSRSLGSYISSFITDKFGLESREDVGKVGVVTYTDVGLILICLTPEPGESRTLYVVNPISRQSVEIPPPPRSLIGKLRFRFRPSGLVTQVGNGVVLGYKVVMTDLPRFHDANLLIYSSETLDYEEVVVSHDFYADSDQCQVILFPDSDEKQEISTEEFAGLVKGF